VKSVWIDTSLSTSNLPVNGCKGKCVVYSLLYCYDNDCKYVVCCYEQLNKSCMLTVLPVQMEFFLKHIYNFLSILCVFSMKIFE